MCGINGILGHIDDPVSQINKMNDRIVHRGPDAEGVWYDKERPVFFGHRRLAILELSEKGAQPMVSTSGNFVIVFNGEIYNYLELKKELLNSGSGVRFRGNSDTELLLNMIEEYGISGTLEQIVGMFAFAVYDKTTGNVTLARDRMGEKPLYFGRTAECFVFASDIGSIEAIDGFEAKINNGILSAYFKGGYIPAPYTVYEGIYKLRPGHFLTITAPYRDWKDECYWDIKKIAKKGQESLFKGSFEEASCELEHILKTSVKRQMISDVGLGAFLSGGIDSTLTVSLMQSISERPVRTFTIGFEDAKYNEAEYAKETANHLGTEHTEMYVTKNDVLDIIKQIPVAYTEPFADSSQIPTMLVSKMTRRHVTVSLSGDAGDEFFCGYNSYKDVRRGLEILGSKLPFIRGGLRSGLGSMIYAVGGSRNRTMHKISSVLSIDTPEKWYRNIREDDILLDRLSVHGEALKDAIDEYPDGYMDEPEHNLMLMDMLEYLPDDILVKVDRAGMFYSLESRIPLLDRDVMEFAWTLPLEYKYDGITTKKILKDILYRYVPKDMMDRPKKGFSVPLGSWLRGEELRDWAEDMLSFGRNRLKDSINTSVADIMWRRFLDSGEGERNIWNILMLYQWFEKRANRIY